GLPGARLAPRSPSEDRGADVRVRRRRRAPAPRRRRALVPLVQAAPVRRGARLLALAACSALVLAAAAPGRAANEGNGPRVCISARGPGVVIPLAPAGPPSSTSLYELRCPGRGQIVGGLDARVSHPAIQVTFFGALGSPVNPGITTSTS